MNITLFWIIYDSMMGVECLVLIPFILHHKLLDAPSKWILYYIISSVVFAGGSHLLQKFAINNMAFFSAMHFLQFIILSVFYWLCIKNVVMRNIIKYMPVAVLLIFMFDVFYIEGVRAYNSISSGVKHLVILIYGIYYFMQMLRDKSLIEKSVYIDSLPVFWYNAGIFIFFCTAFLFSISYNYLQGLQATGSGKMLMTMVILSINYIVGIISMILFYIGLSKIKKMRYAGS